MEISMNELNELDLHDSGLCAIVLNGDQRTLEIEFDQWNLDLKLAEKSRLIFFKPTGINFWEIPAIHSLQISSHEIIKLDSQYKAEFLIIIGIGKELFKLTFNYSKVELINGLGDFV